MKLNELKDVLSAETVKVYIDYGVYDEFIRKEEIDYFNECEHNLWEIYGEDNIEQIYVNDDCICIDLE